MNTVTITDDNELLIKPHGLNKIWGFRKELRVPLSHVKSAKLDCNIGRNPPLLRLLGLSLPGKHVGTFSRDKKISYWNISDREHNVIIEFINEGFAYAVLTVESPANTARMIEQAIGEDSV